MTSEIDAPKSGISELKCQDLFPPAPLPITARLDEDLDPGSQPTPPFSEASSATPIRTPSLTTDKTATWYYYITEISLRRLINRILNTFYVCSFRSWNPDTAHWMVEQAGEFEDQLEAWSVDVSFCNRVHANTVTTRLRSLPEELQFFDLSSSQISADEHRFALRQRYVHIRTLLYRPFLYLSIQHSDKLPSRLIDKVLSLAYESINTCFLMNDGIGIHYRYEGTWYACRLSGVHILTLIAADRAGLFDSTRFRETGIDRVQLERSLVVHKATLNYWAQESADVAALRDAVCGLDLASR